jgi:16S rRNA (cytosine967-C5)-methyltransferase
MNERLRAFAARVISYANREHPADGVLRKELRGQKEFSRENSREISHAVFSFYRWYGCLDKSLPVEQQITEAVELDNTFVNDPSSITDDDLLKTVPAWVEDHMEVSIKWLEAIQQRPRLWLRTQPGQADAVSAILKNATPGPLPDSLLYAGIQDLFTVPEFQAGQFQLQDIASQAVSWVCAPKSRQLWWDTCAGEGGKMLHLTALMGVKGSVWATDRAEWRLQRLKLRARRCQVFNYRLALWEGGPDLPSDLKFDGILVDAPCSGIGTWQRNPHARWTATPNDIVELAIVQKKLLDNAIAALKPGGKLVYAVCTPAREETMDVVNAFSQDHPDFHPHPFPNPFAPQEPPVTSLMMWPHLFGGNGMFTAAWQKEKPVEIAPVEEKTEEKVPEPAPAAEAAK